MNKSINSCTFALSKENQTIIKQRIMTEKEFKKSKAHVRSCSKRDYELMWIEIINSCFCYGETYKLPRYINNYVCKGVTLKRLEKLQDEQLSYLEKSAVIEKNVAEDGGISYNNLKW